ncbi:carboxypeptidase-like regulatory domain-containing protein [Niabella defluvii]|nr:carboxypeptidase-like regulatory domain-containing protein [Niabella sp. I65]
MTAMKLLLAALFVLLISTTPVLAQTGTGKITGKITTSDHNKAQGVTVELAGKQQSTITNESGYFSFNKLAPGNYTIRISLIGHNDTEKQVTVTAGQTSEIELQLSISATNLNEVVVVGHKNGINVNTASSSLRVQTPLIELSQNVQVVTSRYWQISKSSA